LIDKFARQALEKEKQELAEWANAVEKSADQFDLNEAIALKKFF